MHQRAGLTLIVGPDLLLTPDHADRRKAQPIVILARETDIVRLIRSRNQADRRQLNPLADGVMDPLRVRDIGIDHERDDTARPSVAVRLSAIGGLNLIEGEEANDTYHRHKPDETSHS